MPAPAAPATSFSAVLASIANDGDGYRATVTEDWGQGRATFGGLLSAIANQVLRKLVPRDRPLRSLQTTFVGPAPAGEWKIAANVLRSGKSVTVARCDIIVSGEVAASVTGVYGQGRSSAVTVAPASVAALGTPEETDEWQYVEGVPVFTRHFAFRWTLGSKLFTSSTATSTQVFIRHRDTAPLTESHVVGLVDCIPSPALAMLDAPAPASSLVWTLELFEHRFDFSPESWWRLDTRIDTARDGYVHQTGLLTNPLGHPAALTRQVVAVFG